MGTTQRNYRYLDIITAVFVTVLLLSNLLSSAKIIDTQAILFDLPLVFDAGTLLFPLAYIFGDILTEVYGYRAARRVIWTGFFSLILMSFFVWLAGAAPGESGWEERVGQTMYEAILGGISSLAIASITAYWIGEFANSYVLARMKIWTQGRFIWMRTIGSTVVGQFADTVIFFVLATWLGAFPADLLLSLIVTNYLIKVGVETFFTPITLLVIRWVKVAENEDYFDYETDFNPFRIG